MKRFSGVVRYTHKLTCLEAGLEKAGSRKKKELYCREVRVNSIRLEGELASCRDVVSAWEGLKYADESVETLMNLLIVLKGSSVCVCEMTEGLPVLPTDVRGWLCDEEAVRELLFRLNRHWVEALEMLGLRSSFRDGGVELLLGDFNMVGIYAAKVLPWTGVVDDFDLICEYWEMIGGEDVASVVLAYSSMVNVWNWFEMFIGMAGCDCDRVMKKWLSSEAYKSEELGDYHFVLEMVLDLERRKGFEAVLGSVMEMISSGASVNRLICFLNVARVFMRNFSSRFHLGEGCSDFDLLARLSVAVRDRNMAGSLFFSGMTDEELRKLDVFLWEKGLRGQRAQRFVTLVKGEIYSCRKSEVFSLDWLFESWGDVFLQVDIRYLEKAYFLAYYCDVTGNDVKRFDLVFKICIRLLGKGMSVMSDVDEFINLIESRKDLIEYVELPDGTWRKIDHVMRSRNRADNFKSGYEKLVGIDCNFVLKSFRVSPGVMVKLCEDVGVLADFEWDECKGWFDYHPLMGGGVMEVLDLLGGYGYSDVAMPVKLLGSIKSGVKLRKEVYERECEVLDRAQVQVFFFEVESFLERMRVKEEGSVLDVHTIQMSKGLDWNKRVFRKFLKKVEGGVVSLTHSHPKNLEWLKARNCFWKPGVWLMGVKDEVVMESFGKVMFETQHHFEDVLKMGTLVQSCLSIGGCNQHSAIANALDVNKQVVFARAENGRFLARQLLAITESGELACFEVYHTSGGKDCKLLEAEFLRLNQEFAERLGMMICDHYDYEVARVVCKDWYDDGLWSDAVKLVEGA